MRLSRAPSPIGVGQRFRQTTGGSGVWVVVGFTTDHAGNPHARMTSESDGTRVVTIALAALRDPKLYRRLSDRLEEEADDTESGWPGHVPAQSGEPS